MTNQTCCLDSALSQGLPRSCIEEADVIRDGVQDWGSETQLAVGPCWLCGWAQPCPSLCLSLLICEMGVTTTTFHDY